MKAKRNRPTQSPVTGRTGSPEALTDPSRQRMLPQRSHAWDPFEVWKTRVKTPQDPGGTAQ